MTGLNGQLVGIYIGEQRGKSKSPKERAELIAGYGLRGDSHAGSDPDRQISLFADEVLKNLISEGFQVSPESISANLYTTNISLDDLQSGTRLKIGESVIEIVEARKPCRSITRIDNRLPKLLYGKCGQLGRIIEGGTVQPGDGIEILSEPDS